ncbi:MAG TPA: response regulator [Nitrospiraceae bacterium]|nr:response regulator [Nitrospiraceae bacterium]
MDDEEAVSEITGQMLARLGYDVEIAQDGAEAIERYVAAGKQQKPFDVVIMDLTIPGGMGGKEAIRKLREIDPGVRAIVSSGYSNDPVMADYGHYGFTAVAAKPYKIHDLSRIIHDIITVGGV